MSRSALPALNEGAFEAAMLRLSPVRGLRPCRAARVFVVNVPNPGMSTLSPLASASPIAENTASTALSACALESEAWGGYVGCELGFLHGEGSRKTAVRGPAW